MARTSPVFICSACQGETPKWQGQCPLCGEWNTLEQRAAPVGRAARKAAALSAAISNASPRRLEIAVGDIGKRLATGYEELDRGLGGGIVPGSVTLLGGDPGIGKSTLLLQVAACVAAPNGVLYASGEESVSQLAARAQRLGLEGTLEVVAESNLEAILCLATERKGTLLIVDSIQTIESNTVDTSPGAVTQLRECTAELVRFAKSSGTAVIIIGHVTKEGAIAGPRMLEHLVDTVTREGGRPLLIELQALGDRMRFGAPRRVAQGLDSNRVAMLLAVMNRHAQLSLQEHDVFVNVVGGVRINETGWDLPVVLALASSLTDRIIPNSLISFGELGLTGEVRPVAYGEERLREAHKQGFRIAVVPKENAPRKPLEGLQVIGVGRVGEALEAAFNRSQ